jgi:hypothetical protein
MKLTQLATYAFDTQYKVEVGVYYAGFLQPYAPSNCTVATPATVTQLLTCDTGLELTNIEDVCFATIVPFATGYKFRISDPLNPLLFEELERPIREFRMVKVITYKPPLRIPMGPTCLTGQPVP